MRFLLLSLALCAGLIMPAIAQEKCPVKFGKVNLEDFDISKANVDMTSGAVIIADVGTSSFEGNNKGWFSLVYKHQRRIKIINKNGFDLANVEIPLYISTKSNDEERVEKLKAYSYNLENGQVIETKLKDDAVFKDKQDKNHIVKKFTMPSVKEGTIIEYSYTIISDFLFNLQDWSFQGEYPRIWSEYEVDLPEFFDYVFLSQGYLLFDIKTSKTRQGNFNVRVPRDDGMKSENFSLNGTVMENHWVIKNVPALKEERYTSSLQNHISKMEFQMSGQRFPNQPYRDIMGNWKKVGEELLKSSDFGEDLSRNNNWLKETINQINGATKDNLAKAKNIFAYIKTNFKNLGNRGIYLTKSLKEIFNAKSGSESEINLLLTAMLKYEDLDANPVLLSTVSHGYTNEMYPLLNRFNYVITKVNIKGNDYFLDASQPYLGFNKLASNCYNGHARVIDKNVTPVYFYADSLTEDKLTSIILFNDEKQPGKWGGSFNVDYGFIESGNTRKQILDKGKTDFEKTLKESYSGEYSIDKIEYRDAEDCENTLKLSYELNVDGNNKSKIIYLNPMMKEGYIQNPFKAAERKYPVEMPYKINDIYTFSIEIPAGYMVDEVPKSTRVLFNEDEGSFEFLVAKSETDVKISSKIKFSKAYFPAEDYPSLRSFFDYIVKKHAENIVFKKKN